MARLTGSEKAIVVRALRHAAPYMRLYKRKVFVLKIGGEMFAEPEMSRSLLEQVGLLQQMGIRIVLVHGGGPQSTELAKSLGLDPQFVAGRRVTDENSLQVAAMVLNGEINTKILAVCRELDIPAVGMSGVDAGLIRAHKRPPVDVEGNETPVDYGFVGDIEGVDADVILRQLENGYMPVVSPLSADTTGTLLNINADTVAAAIASSLGAEKLILCTNAPGILENVDDQNSLISYVDTAGLKRLKAEGKLQGGMLPKVAAIEAALAGGVPRVNVISHQVPDSLLLEVFTNEGTGTLVVNDIGNLSPAEQGSASG